MRVLVRVAKLAWWLKLCAEGTRAFGSVWKSVSSLSYHHYRNVANKNISKKNETGVSNAPQRLLGCKSLYRTKAVFRGMLNTKTGAGTHRTR